MKSRFKGIRTIIAVAILFSTLTSSVYFCYYTVAAADLFSPGLNFEAFDQEILSAACVNELRISIPPSFLNGLCPINYHFGVSYLSSSIIPSLGQETFVLRC